jgi:Flp pilus assembly protein TadG
MTGILRRLASPALGPEPATPAMVSEARAARAAPRIRAGGVASFIRHRGGASAVEFALLAAPFLALLGVVAESGLVTLEQQTLDIAVDRGVRQLRTGIFQDAADGSDPSQRFRKIVCSGPAVLFPCTDLRLDVSRAASFAATSPAEPFDRTKKTWAVGFGTRFDCPQGGDTVTVRVAVPVMRLFQVMDFTGRIMSDKSQMLVTTEIFRAEDYEPKPC